MEDIRVVDGHHFVAANFDGQFLHDGAAQILNHSPVGIFAVQSDREGQPRGAGDNHIVFAKVGEPDKELLVLVDAVRIVGDDQRLPHSFDTQRLVEGAVRIKLAPKFARSHCVLKLCDNLQMSFASSSYFVWLNLILKTPRSIPTGLEKTMIIALTSPTPL